MEFLPFGIIDSNKFNLLLKIIENNSFHVNDFSILESDKASIKIGYEKDERFCFYIELKSEKQNWYTVKPNSSHIVRTIHEGTLENIKFMDDHPLTVISSFEWWVKSVNQTREPFLSLKLNHYDVNNPTDILPFPCYWIHFVQAGHKYHRLHIRFSEASNWSSTSKLLLDYGFYSKSERVNINNVIEYDIEVNFLKEVRDLTSSTHIVFSSDSQVMVSPELFLVTDIKDSTLSFYALPSLRTPAISVM